eukprot:g49724.t1
MVRSLMPEKPPEPFESHPLWHFWSDCKWMVRLELFTKYSFLQRCKDGQVSLKWLCKMDKWFDEQALATPSKSCPTHRDNYAHVTLRTSAVRGERRAAFTTIPQTIAPIFGV